MEFGSCGFGVGREICGQSIGFFGLSLLEESPKWDGFDACFLVVGNGFEAFRFLVFRLRQKMGFCCCSKWLVLLGKCCQVGRFRGVF